MKNKIITPNINQHVLPKSMLNFVERVDCRRTIGDISCTKPPDVHHGISHQILLPSQSNAGMHLRTYRSRWLSLRCAGDPGRFLMYPILKKVLHTMNIQTNQKKCLWFQHIGSPRSESPDSGQRSGTIHMDEAIDWSQPGPENMLEWIR